MRIFRSSSKSLDSFFTAVCSTNEKVGDLVYTTDINGSLPTISKISIDDVCKMPAVGVITKINEDKCEVQHTGRVEDIYFDLIPGSIYFVGEDSKPSLIIPVGLGCFVQRIGVALRTNTLLIINSDFIPRRATS
jgi:hypothetical protein